MGEQEGPTGEVLASVGEGDVDFRWEDSDGTPEVSFEAGPALAVLLARGVVTTNSRWWREDLAPRDREVACLFVDCSDVFTWACAEAEELPFAQVERLYRMWRRDPAWGAAAWCIMRRATPPQKPVADRMGAAGLWDLGRLAAGEDGGAASYVDALPGMGIVGSS